MYKLVVVMLFVSRRVRHSVLLESNVVGGKRDGLLRDG